MEWNYLSIPKIQRPTLYNGCNYSSMSKLKLINAIKRGSRTIYAMNNYVIMISVWSIKKRYFFHHLLNTSVYRRMAKPHWHAMEVVPRWTHNYFFRTDFVFTFSHVTSGYFSWYRYGTGQNYSIHSRVEIPFEIYENVRSVKKIVWL